jgi:hypothetical protein
MRNYLIFLAIVLLCLIVSSSCEKDNYELDKTNLINPIDSINSFFIQAEKIAGVGTTLYLISGVQKDKTSSLSYNMNWKLSFIKDRRIITFEIIQGKTIVSDITTQELPMGNEYIYKDDDRLKSILSPKSVWDSCINKYNKPILIIEILSPLIAQKSNFIYNFYSKEGYNQMGVDFFLFDAKSGDDLTNK